MSTKIYTKTGDQGTTCILKGKTRVSKTNVVLVACGDIDELNSWLGVCKNIELFSKNPNTFDFNRLQRILMDVMTYIAQDNSSIEFKLPIKWLEDTIDTINLNVPSLTQFILPGSSKDEAFVHLTRCVARRAERSVVAATENEDVLAFINRLSDLIFMLGRLLTYGNDNVELLRHSNKQKM